MDTLEEATMGRSWFEALKKEFTKPYFVRVCSRFPRLDVHSCDGHQLKKDLAAEQASHTIYPAREDIFPEPSQISC